MIYNWQDHKPYNRNLVYHIGDSIVGSFYSSDVVSIRNMTRNRTITWLNPASNNLAISAYSTDKLVRNLNNNNLIRWNSNKLGRVRLNNYDTNQQLINPYYSSNLKDVPLNEFLNKLIRDSINLILSQPGYAIKGRQNAPRPNVAYANVNYISSVNIGNEERTFENKFDDLNECITGSRSILFSINFHKDEADNNARRVQIGLIRESIQELFRASKVGLTSRSSVRNVSSALENGWEERSQLDITLNVVDSDSDIVRAICSVDIAGAFQARGLEYNFNIEVQ